MNTVFEKQSDNYYTWSFMDQSNFFSGTLTIYKDERKGISIEWDNDFPENYEAYETQLLKEFDKQKVREKVFNEAKEHLEEDDLFMLLENLGFRFVSGLKWHIDDVELNDEEQGRLTDEEKGSILEDALTTFDGGLQEEINSEISRKIEEHFQDNPQ